MPRRAPRDSDGNIDVADLPTDDAGHPVRDEWPICGAATKDDRPCVRTVLKRGLRCHEHRGEPSVLATG